MSASECGSCQNQQYPKRETTDDPTLSRRFSLSFGEGLSAGIITQERSNKKDKGIAWYYRLERLQNRAQIPMCKLTRGQLDCAAIRDRYKYSQEGQFFVNRYILNPCNQRDWKEDHMHRGRKEPVKWFCFN